MKIDLPSFAEWLNSTPGTVIDYLASRIEQRTTGQVAASILQNQLFSQPTFFFFDGLDEVPASANRQQVIDAVSGLLVDAKAANADIAVLATTRPQGYGGEFRENGFVEYRLEDLDQKRASSYATALTRNRYPDDPDRDQLVIKRVAKAFKDPQTSALMSSPLRVSILVTLLDRKGAAPRDIYGLYKSYYDAIRSREIEREIPASSIISENQLLVDDLHQRIALLLQAKSERGGGTESLVTVEQFEQIIAELLRLRGEPELEIKTKVAQIKTAAVERLVLLVAPRDGFYRYEIRSFQEFMAAEAIVDGSDAAVQLRMEHIAPLQSWRNVYVIASAKCYAERKSLRPALLIGACTTLNEAPADNNQLCSITLSGSELACDLLGGGFLWDSRAELNALVRVALRGLDHPEMAEPVARAIEPMLARTDDVVREHLSKCTQPVGALMFLASLENLDAHSLLAATVEDTIERIDPGELVLTAGMNDTVKASVCQRLARERSFGLLTLTSAHWAHLNVDLSGAPPHLRIASRCNRIRRRVQIVRSRWGALMLPCSSEDLCAAVYNEKQTSPFWEALVKFLESPVPDTLATLIESVNLSDDDTFEGIGTLRDLIPLLVRHLVHLLFILGESKRDEMVRVIRAMDADRLRRVIREPDILDPPEELSWSHVVRRQLEEPDFGGGDNLLWPAFQYFPFPPRHSPGIADLLGSIAAQLRSCRDESRRAAIQELAGQALGFVASDGADGTACSGEVRDVLTLLTPASVARLVESGTWLGSASTPDSVGPLIAGSVSFEVSLKLAQPLVLEPVAMLFSDSFGSTEGFPITSLILLASNHPLERVRQRLSTDHDVPDDPGAIAIRSWIVHPNDVTTSALLEFAESSTDDVFGALLRRVLEAASTLDASAIYHRCTPGRQEVMRRVLRSFLREQPSRLLSQPGEFSFRLVGEVLHPCPESWSAALELATWAAARRVSRIRRCGFGRCRGSSRRCPCLGRCRWRP